MLLIVSNLLVFKEEFSLIEVKPVVGIPEEEVVAPDASSL